MGDATLNNIDLYEELGLSASDSAGELKNHLLNDIQPQWISRASLAGDMGDRARRNLRLIELALEAFVDEDSKLRYDSALRRRDNTDEQTGDVDWLSRGWNYYFLGEYDAALIAARKLRERDRDSVACYLLSAWVNLAYGRQENTRRALADANEAFVLDNGGSDAIAVADVRGYAHMALGNTEEALHAYSKGLPGAIDNSATFLSMPKNEDTFLLWLGLSRCCFVLKQYERAFNVALYVLHADYPVSSDLAELALDQASEAMVTGYECGVFTSALLENRRDVLDQAAYEELKRLFEEVDGLRAQRDELNRKKEPIKQRRDYLQSDMVSKKSSYKESQDMVELFDAAPVLSIISGGLAFFSTSLLG